MENIRTQAELAALAQQFANAEEFLKKTRAFQANFAHPGTLAELPHYLLIGPSGSGKTSLITQAGLTLYPAAHLATAPQDESSAFKHCNWWISDRGIFLDIPGSYLTLNEKAGTLHWPAFVKLFKSYIKNKTFAGIILVGNVAELCAPAQSLLDTWLNLRQSLVLLNATLKFQCPIHLVLTHIDQIKGFGEFFLDLGIEESEQLFGIDLNSTEHKTNLTQTFKKCFDTFLQRLTQRMIWRLNQESNSSKRKLIQFFPMQLENLKEPLAQLIYQLADMTYRKNPALQGVYFTSSLQQGTALDLFANTLHAITTTTSPKKATDLITATREITAPHILTANNSYFAKQLFIKISTPATLAHQPKRVWLRRNKLRFTAYTLGTALLLSSGSLLAYTIQRQLTQLSTLQNALTEYRFLTAQLPANAATLNQVLPPLNDLCQVDSTLKSLRRLNPLLPEIHHAVKMAEQVYQQNLGRYFLSALNQILLSQLSTIQDPGATYSALKTYLMLGEPNHLQSTYIQNWFDHYWQQTYASKPAWQQQLTAHLSALLSQPFTPIELDPGVLTKARSFLTMQPLNQLVLLTIRNQDLGAPVNLLQALSKNKLSLFSTNKVLIPAIYSAQGFKQVYFNSIPDLSTQLTHGDWILGNITPVSGTPSNSPKEVTDQVRKLYLQDYVAYWKTLLTQNLRLATWSNLTQAQTALHMLASKHDPLLTLLRSIAENISAASLTAGVSVSSSETDVIRTQLSSLSMPIINWLAQADNTKTNPLPALSQNLMGLQDYLASARNDKLAFLAAQSRFNAAGHAQDPISKLWQNAITLPAPLNLWMGQIADNSWRLLLQKTTQYLDETWRSQVLTEYQTELQNNYPLWKTSNQDISLTKFAHFFADNGTLHNYFKNYLAAFIDTSGVQWQPRKLDNRSLNVPQSALTQFERADIIRSMFFDDKDKLAVKFTLTPLAMEPDVIGLNLQINGQSLLTRQNNLKGYNFVWPGPDPDAGMTLKFIDNAGHEASLKQTGAWGLFHIMDKTTLQPVKNSGRYNVVFDLNGNAVRYQLTAWKLINPFIPGIIDQFRCPELIANE